ncbi:Eco57I restriction-modification methylase domain-containing protein [Leptospira levettii]|uniref:Eco57I restriction-modification methylase domain-containing protein n=1 Tax=Leptospira levettii TaxID=2023178 RepID=UPI003EB81C99
MKALAKELRRQLESTVKQARNVAEEGARIALERINVPDVNPNPRLNEAQKKLRNELRALGRQIGDKRKPSGEQEIIMLLEHVSYEHWHRMLFARFLAENQLLIHPEYKVPVSLNECEELGANTNKSKWEQAGEFAKEMLPQIFRTSSPVWSLTLPPENERELERLLSSLPEEVFTADDSLGWVYQFWRAEEKDRVNDSEVKIGARELPAVTQLFTEEYMVSFLLDNALGAWWAGQCLTPKDYEDASQESEDPLVVESALRQKIAIPGAEFAYLRFAKTADGKWEPAGGTFPGWPKQLAELKVLDPCCGSGHFLVGVFYLLVALRRHIEKLSAKEAVHSVLSQNLFGLDLDKRVTEISAFALALTAWKYPEAGGYRELPELQIACSGLSAGSDPKEWKQLAGSDKELGTSLKWLHEEFQSAPYLGSLLNPAQSVAAKQTKWDRLSVFLQQALQKEQNEETLESGIAAQGIAKAGELLSAHYHFVVTNVPYLARGKQIDELKDFCEKNYLEAKNDLATVFLARLLEFCEVGGSTSVVLPQNWLFLTSYKKFREGLLQRERWNLIARLGPGAFETISGEVVKAILITLTRQNPPSSIQSKGAKDVLLPMASASGSVQYLRGLDVSSAGSARDKAEQLFVVGVRSVEQGKLLLNKNHNISIDLSSDISVRNFAKVYGGITTGDSLRYRKCFWEMERITPIFSFLQHSVREANFFSGREYVIKWENGKGTLLHDSIYAGATIAGKEAWNRAGIALTYTGKLSATIYSGELFENVICILIPLKKEYFSFLYSFCSSERFATEVRKVNQKLSVDVKYFEAVPFDLDYWTKVAQEKYPHGLPEPFSDDPTQWIFHGHPCGSVVWSESTKRTSHGALRKDKTVLHIAVARLLGYQWPAETDPKMELAKEQREWVEKTKAFASFVDQDGIVCIPPVRGEGPADERVLDVLRLAYGKDWNPGVLSELLTALGKPSWDLERYLRDQFFEDHCSIFQNRPFLWQIWDGLRDGFSAIVNYHKLDQRNLETLTYSYLGDWIRAQEAGVKEKKSGAEEKLVAAKALQKKLQLILEGEKPYDIFVRWKSLGEQPFGWNPDLNDGVRLNIRPFVKAEILRVKSPKGIKWEKDRGKDVESAPWFKKFGGERINDHHTSLEEKKKARGEK